MDGVQSFEPWGVPDPTKHAGNEQGISLLTELFGFAGERQDAWTGQSEQAGQTGQIGAVYLRNRWLHPHYARFLSQYPYPGDQSWPLTHHRYAYALENPTSRTDPSGLFVSGVFNALDGEYANDDLRLFDPLSRDLEDAQTLLASFIGGPGDELPATNGLVPSAVAPPAALHPARDHGPEAAMAAAGVPDFIQQEIRFFILQLPKLPDPVRQILADLTDETPRKIGDTWFSHKVQDNGQLWFGRFEQFSWDRQFVPYTFVGNSDPQVGCIQILGICVPNPFKGPGKGPKPGPEPKPPAPPKPKPPGRAPSLCPALAPVRSPSRPKSALRRRNGTRNRTRTVVQSAHLRASCGCHRYISVDLWRRRGESASAGHQDGYPSSNSV